MSKMITAFSRDLRTGQNPVFTSVRYSQCNPAYSYITSIDLVFEESVMYPLKRSYFFNTEPSVKSKKYFNMIKISRKQIFNI